MLHGPMMYLLTYYNMVEKKKSNRNFTTAVEFKPVKWINVSMKKVQMKSAMQKNGDKKCKCS